jgi:hypothetical protein
MYVGARLGVKEAPLSRKRRTMKTPLKIAAVILAVSVCAQNAPADVTYSDGTFNNADWQVSMLFQSYNGGSVTGTQVASGGNPGPYRSIDTSVNPIGSNPYSNVLGFNQWLPDTYNPAALGAISGIDFSIDFLNINTFGNGQGFELALSQNGSLYGLLPHNTGTSGGWQHFALSAVTANDFYQIRSVPPIYMFDGAHHPDFSATGAPISFGFYAATATTDVPFTLTAGYDNWSVTAHSRPEPSTFVLAGLGGLAFLAWRRRFA